MARKHIRTTGHFEALIKLRGKREVDCISPDHVCSLASSTKTNFAHPEADKTSKRVRAVTFLAFLCTRSTKLAVVVELLCRLRAVTFFYYKTKRCDAISSISKRRFYNSSVCFFSYKNGKNFPLP